MRLVTDQTADQAITDLFLLGVPLAQIEAGLIRRQLQVSRGNRCEVARIMRQNRNTIASKIKRYGIEVKP